MKFLMGLFAALLMVGTAHAGKQGGWYAGKQGQKTGGFKGSIIVQDAADAKGYLWNLKAGSTVTLSSSLVTEAGDVKGPDILAEVVKKDETSCTVKYTANGHGSETVMGSKDGYFCYGLLKDGAFDAKMRLFKYDAKAGDTWDGWAAKEEGQSEVTVKYVGLEEVKVPAGTYKDVLHVQAVVTNGPTIDYYYAPKMGMIKFTFSMDGEVRRRLEMTAFTEGK